MTIPHETIMNDKKYEGFSLRKRTLVAGYEKINIRCRQSITTPTSKRE